MSKPRLVRWLFAAGAFLSSFELFLIEPMQGKMLLPLFGGAPAIWNTCMVFFQAVLLCGYVYAHFTTSKLSVAKQLGLQLSVLALPLFFLPIALPSLNIQTEWLSTEPLKWLLVVLVLTTGAAFFAVSTASPLLQSWYYRVTQGTGKDPYALYAAGNLGSLVALVAYPTVIEPCLRLAEQSLLWSVGYGLTILTFAIAGVLVYRARNNLLPVVDEGALAKVTFDLSDATSLEEWMMPRTSFSARTDFQQRLIWVVLAFIPSSLMLGVTTYMTTDVASVPMLWIVPLLLYIASFVIVFWRYPDWLNKGLRRLMPLAMVVLAFLVFTSFHQNFGILVGIHLAGFFIAALICHGNLAKSKPHPSRLTEFYFWVSLGGVLGGAFNSFVAPAIFSSVAEYPLMLVLALLAGTLVAGRQQTSMRDWIWGAICCAAFAWLMGYTRQLYLDREFEFLAVKFSAWFAKDVTHTALTYGLPFALSLLLIHKPLRHGAAVLGVTLAALFQGIDGQVLERTRSFFGVLTVKEYESSDLHMLVNGGILHGEQLLDDGEKRLVPRSYYHPDGPLGQIITDVSAKRTNPNIAAIGLGTGAVAAYGKPDNRITFYEINPGVERVARNPELFTYLDDCVRRWCHVSVVIGDGRLKLAETMERYDLIIVDAFSSDAIPIHLITREAMQLYLDRLNPGGIVAYHISNRYMNLEPVLLHQAIDLGLGYAVRSDDGDESIGKGASTWAIVAKDQGIYEIIVHDERWRGLEDNPKVGVWADDYANVISTFTWF